MPSAKADSDPAAALLDGSMSYAQRKALLKQLQSPDTIASLRRPEILLDFFTDSLDTGDLALSVPALSGLFHLIATKNLDYPAFYPRVYALLTPALLPSKYRSRVLRHLDIFLAPTNHLPAATVASFIKRLARLALVAPPAAIVAVVPFIYNLLKAYPATTFLIHRRPFPPYTQPGEALGVDPYDPAELDPQRTRAIDSSLWEIETLQSHYHPTVSGIARVISEQFTKAQYNLEDFLDHGYNSLLAQELGKEVKKPPPVEYRIPKHAFREEDDDQEQQSRRLVRLDDFWEF